jgi:hypothetical protein
MKHGIIFFEGTTRGTTPGSRLWTFCMNRGEFPALYTHRGLETGGGGDCFREAFTRNVDVGNETGLGEYARYDPPYDRPFLIICSRIAALEFPTVVVPVTATDAEAMELVTTCAAISSAYLCRFLEISRRKRMPGWIRLFDLIRPMPLPCQWAYLIVALHRLNATLLVAHDAKQIDAFERCEGLGEMDGIVERW